MMHALARARSLARALRRDEDGGIAILFAFMLLPLLYASGAALDYARTLAQRGQAQVALDAALLAATRPGQSEGERIALAERYFRAQAGPEISGRVETLGFAVENGDFLRGEASFGVPTTLAGVMGHRAVVARVTAKVTIAKPEVRGLDILMCVDATGSMGNTIAAVKRNALDFERNLNARLRAYNVADFEAMRVRVVFDRDDGGFPSYAGPDPKNFGDKPPMKPSAFWSLPARRDEFAAYVEPETAKGGGDLPEAGLECVNEGLDSSWARVGDGVGNVGRRLTSIYPVIIAWTDAPTHPPAHPASLRNPDDPSAARMPRDYPGLRAKWDAPRVIDQDHKLLVLFTNNVNVEGWSTLRDWPGFVRGGTLTQGTDDMVDAIARAIAKVPDSGPSVVVSRTPDSGPEANGNGPELQ